MCIAERNLDVHFSGEFCVKEKEIHLRVMFIDIILFFCQQLEARQVAPPFKPIIEDQYGLANFDPQFTNEPVQLTPDDP